MNSRNSVSVSLAFLLLGTAHMSSSNSLGILHEVLKRDLVEDKPNFLVGGENKEWECAPVARPSTRPELIHIRKTGGSTLEILGALNNVSWGACHWFDRINGMPKGSNCPPNSRNQQKDPEIIDPTWRMYKWHLPPKYMPPQDTFWMKNASLFAVVRDPYERSVSAWNYANSNAPERIGNATLMNAHIVTSLRKQIENRPRYGSLPGKPYFRGELPQSDYIDENVRVLRLETLERDFQCMMRGHGIRWEWPQRKVFNKSNKHNSLTTSDLTIETRAMIALAYHEDFVRFGYPIDQEI